MKTSSAAKLVVILCILCLAAGFMRQEKCEYDKTELQSLLEGSEPGSEDSQNFEIMLNRTLERRRMLDILIDNINMIDFKNGK